MDDALDLVWGLAEELYGERGHHMPAFCFLGDEGLGRLDGALALVEHAYYESEAHATACMFRALVQDHPFQDGNKRFAIIATSVVLLLNRRLAVISNGEWEVLALGVAQNDVTIAGLTEFFASRIGLPLAEDFSEWAGRMREEAPREALTEVARTMVALREHIRKVTSG